MVTYEGTIKSTVILSDNKRYRYRLTRAWDPTKKKATVIMLNPSIADALKVDKTVMNLTNYLIDNNFGSVDIVNLFSYISTDPTELSKSEEEYEIKNNEHISAAIKEAHTVIIAWVRGGNKFVQARKKEIEAMLLPYKDKVKCFKDNQGRKPRHPRDLGKGWTIEDYEF